MRVIGLAVAGLLMVSYALYILVDPFGSRYDWFFDNVVTDLILLAPAVACIHRAVVVRRGRIAWAVIGCAFLFEAFADVYWNAIIANLDDPPYPSIADYFYIAFYPAMALGLIALALQNGRRVRGSLWLHVLIAVLTISALDAALVFDSVASSGGAAGWEAAVNLAYPLGDVVLLAGVTGVWALSGWRPSSTWVWLGLGMVVFAAGDSVYLYQLMKETYVVGGLLDLSWTLAAFMMLIAATRQGDASVQLRGEASQWLFLPTALLSTVALAVLGWSHFHSVGDLAVFLALGASFLTVAQLGLAFAENSRLMLRSEKEALIDHVTGLPNRRKLFLDLELAGSTSGPSTPVVLALFDLDGFKSINDAHGHAAGDELLERFGGRLDDVAAERGNAYRLGGDEFCVLLNLSLDDAAPLLRDAAKMLSERGKDFTVTSSYGFVSIPAETRDPDEALSIADHRMYAAKREANSSAGQLGTPTTIDRFPNARSV